MAAIDSHPAVKVVSPQAPVSDWFMGDDMHHNGALFLAQGFYALAFLGQPRPAPLKPSPDFDNEDLYGALETYRRVEQQNPGAFTRPNR